MNTFCHGIFCCRYRALLLGKTVPSRTGGKAWKGAKGKAVNGSGPELASSSGGEEEAGEVEDTKLEMQVNCVDGCLSHLICGIAEEGSKGLGLIEVLPLSSFFWII